MNEDMKASCKVLVTTFCPLCISSPEILASGCLKHTWKTQLRRRRLIPFPSFIRSVKTNFLVSCPPRESGACKYGECVKLYIFISGFKPDLKKLLGNITKLVPRCSFECCLCNDLNSHSCKFL